MTTSAATATTQTGPAEGPGASVRSFLDSYVDGDFGAACRFVGPGFTNPRDRELRRPDYCKVGDDDPADALAQTLELKDSEITGDRARVLAINAKRGQLMFVMLRRLERWQIIRVEALPRLNPGDEPELP